MSEAARYKQKGRTFEQRENWKRAIEAYELAIDADIRAGREVDLSLYNRIGDLYRRIGDVNMAVEYYEKAADGHIAAGFYNNAIALCNKILRNQPNRHSIYLKLGKIGAAKGFLSDARKHFLEYAERMQKANKLDEAFSALIEFADLSPDPDVRLMIAEQLIEHERTAQAVEQLRLAWRDLKNEGRDAHADDIRERIVEMDPDRDPESDPPEAATLSILDAEGVIDLPELPPLGEPEPEALAGAAMELTDDLEIVPTSLDDRVGESEAEGSVLVDEESLEIEPTVLATEGMEVEPEEGDVGTGVAEAGLDEPSAGLEPASSVVDEDTSSAAVAPALAEPEGTPEPGEAGAAERVAELEDRLREEGPDPALLVELSDVLLEMGNRVRATERLGEALVLYETRGEYREADHVLSELVRLNVNDVRAYHKRVELALRRGERTALIAAYLDLADCLDRTEAGDRARAVYKRVLELDASNARALAALDLLGSHEPEAPVSAGAGAQGSGPDEYVDLGSLVLEEESQNQSTRFVMSADDPQSEDEVNFSEMLRHFQSKVSETIEEDDASSHYDLGVAFKEMGLIDEAIAEFQMAARGPDYRLRAIEMLGACFMEKEDHRIAVKVLTRALQVPGYRDEELVGIFYALGRAYEALGESKRSLEWYERVMGCDVTFKDVAERVSALRR